MNNSPVTIVKCKENTAMAVADMLELFALKSEYSCFDNAVSDVLDLAGEDTVVLTIKHYADDYFEGAVLVYVDDDGFKVGVKINCCAAKQFAIEVVSCAVYN